MRLSNTIVAALYTSYILNVRKLIRVCIICLQSFGLCCANFHTYSSQYAADLRRRLGEDECLTNFKNLFILRGICRVIEGCVEKFSGVRARENWKQSCCIRKLCVFCFLLLYRRHYLMIKFVMQGSMSKTVCLRWQESDLRYPMRW